MTKQAKTDLVEYVPIGQENAISVSVDQAIDWLAERTKSGQAPDRKTAIKWLLLCRQLLLDPWVGDAYLIGFDTKDGPKFQLVVAHQALLKRAHAMREEFDGFESGVVVRNSDTGEVTERHGTLVLPEERLVGAWAAVYRNDCSHRFYDSLNLSAREKPTSVWRTDPAGMIVKCAEASALRKAFPQQLGGAYTESELQEERKTQRRAAIADQPAMISGADMAALTARMAPPPAEEPKRPASGPEKPADEPQEPAGVTKPESAKEPQEAAQAAHNEAPGPSPAEAPDLFAGDKSGELPF